MKDEKANSMPLSGRDNLKRLAHPNDDDDGEEVLPYREFTSYVPFLSVCIRPDIAHAASQLARRVFRAHEIHREALKGFRRYVKDSKNFGLYYKVDIANYSLYAYVDASWADYILTRRPTSGIVTYIGPHFVDWSSKLQSIVAHSTAEAECVAADSATRMLVVKGFVKILECGTVETVINS